MNEYYGAPTTPTSDYLAHYGVKGMKWGVRKALEKRDPKALEKQYKKALRKAKKLNTKVNISKSAQEYKGRMSDGAALGLAGATIAGVPLGLRALARSQNARAIGAGHVGLLPIAYDTETTPYVTTPIGGALGALGAYQLAKGIAAKRRTKPIGHAKAKAKAEEWRKEMKTAFKNTKYSKLPGAGGENKAYEYVPMGTQYKNAAIDSVVHPGYTASKKAVGGYNKKKKHK